MVSLSTFFSVITQRLWGGALRDNTKCCEGVSVGEGCEGMGVEAWLKGRECQRWLSHFVFFFGISYHRFTKNQRLQMAFLLSAGLRVPTTAMLLTSENGMYLWQLRWTWGINQQFMAVFTPLTNKMLGFVYPLLDEQLRMTIWMYISPVPLFLM